MSVSLHSVLSLWGTLRHLQRPSVAQAEVHTAGRGSRRERLDSQMRVPPSRRGCQQAQPYSGFPTRSQGGSLSPLQGLDNVEEELAEITMQALKDREGCCEPPSSSSGRDVAITVSNSQQLWQAAQDWAHQYSIMDREWASEAPPSPRS